MIGILIAVLLAALVYAFLAALTGSAIGGALLVLLAGIPSGGFGLGSRFGGRHGAGCVECGAPSADGRGRSRSIDSRRGRPSGG
jgi:hypothetical protein